MKILVFLFLLLGYLGATEYPLYKKEITLPPITQPTLVKVALDAELYAHTQVNYADIRLRSGQGEEGYLIKKIEQKYHIHHKRLSASSYLRRDSTFTYELKEPFEIDKIELHIEDRNFESYFDVTIDDRLVVKNYKIYDYSRETGNVDFSIELKPTIAKKIQIHYHLDKTSSFYKKYKDIQKATQYLTMKSITISNHSREEALRYPHYKVALESMESKDKKSSYVFNIKNSPFVKLGVQPLEKNFNRQGRLFYSSDASTWYRLGSFTLSSSSINNDKHQNMITFQHRSNFIKLEIDNLDNRPLTINEIEFFEMPYSLYFIANPDEKYSLYFGQEQQMRMPNYDLRSLITDKTPFVEGKIGVIEPLDITIEKPKISFFEAYRELIFIVVLLLALGVMGYIAFGLLKEKS